MNAGIVRQHNFNGRSLIAQIDEQAKRCSHTVQCLLHPPAVQGRIFDPFFTTKPVGQGTGLGLSLSHGIIERHQGRITVSSTPESGTKFVIDLPLDATPADE